MELKKKLCNKVNNPAKNKQNKEDRKGVMSKQ